MPKTHVGSWLRLTLVFLAAWGVSGMLATGSQVASAQEDEPVDVEADAQPEPAAPAAGGAADDVQPVAPPAPRSRLYWMVGSLGIFYSLVFLGLSFTLVALFVMNLLTAQRNNMVPVSLVADFENHLNEKRYQEAFELAKADESVLGRVLSAGLAQIKRGYQPALEAMQEVGEEENMKLEHRLSYMALIGTVSPMIGLLGTVQGMIAAFNVIANSAATPKPAELALGISTALFTTLVGLAIAIPAIAAFNILRNRVSRMILEVGIVSEGLMNRFSETGKKS